MMTMLCIFMLIIFVSGLVVFTVGLGVMLIAGAVLSILGWFFGSFVKYKVLRAFRTYSPWVGFVPFLGTYALGKTCIGRDGQNLGIFEVSLPNWFWEFGWLSATAINMILSSYEHTYGSSESLSKLAIVATQVLIFMYWASVYQFIYTRLEHKTPDEVRLISIVSGLFSIIGFFRVMSLPVSVIYSCPNDVYPCESYPNQDLDW